MFARVHSMGLWGIDAFPVEVEADIARGMPSFQVVGLADTAVKESRDRVMAAMQNSGLSCREGRTVVNLAPADVRKNGAVYDLPILLALLGASGLLRPDWADAAFAGELSLDGTLRPVAGALSMAVKARELGYRAFFLPAENAAEAAVVEGLAVFGVPSLQALLGHLRGETPLPPAQPGAGAAEPMQGADFSEVRGQQLARRAVEVAVAGMHNLLLIGAPGAGKSMLAKRIPTLLGELDFAQSLETTRIHSVAGLLPPGSGLMRLPPFRAPHHTISAAGLAGGGNIPKPGEISLAHNGVLFLDELPEFSRSAMEALRQPLENGFVTLARAAGRLRYPSRFMLVAAMNPCPCGYLGHPSRPCTCAPGAARRYLGKISGPLLDRIDLQVEVLPVEYDQLAAPGEAESSAAMAGRVRAARQRQRRRYANSGIQVNAQLTPAQLREVCTFSGDASALLRGAFERLELSARAYDRICKVARTIADLEGSERIELPHVAEAIQYRGLDRKFWGAGL